MTASLTEGIVDGEDECVGVKRLAKEESKRRCVPILNVRTGYDDHGDGARLGSCPQLLVDIQPVESWEAQVEDNGIRYFPRVDRAKGINTVFHGDDVESGR